MFFLLIFFWILLKLEIKLRWGQEEEGKKRKEKRERKERKERRGG